MNMVDMGEILTKECFINKISTLRESTTAEDYTGDLPLDYYLENVEKKIIEYELLKSNNNISKTAEGLKISRQSLQYKIKKYNL